MSLHLYSPSRRYTWKFPDCQCYLYCTTREASYYNYMSMTQEPESLKRTCYNYSFLSAFIQRDHPHIKVIHELNIHCLPSKISSMLKIHSSYLSFSFPKFVFLFPRYNKNENYLEILFFFSTLSSNFKKLKLAALRANKIILFFCWINSLII